MPSRFLGQVHVDFSSRQVTFYSPLSNKQGPRQAVCQLNKKKIGLAKGKQNLRAA